MSGSVLPDTSLRASVAPAMVRDERTDAVGNGVGTGSGGGGSSGDGSSSGSGNGSSGGGSAGSGSGDRASGRARCWLAGTAFFATIAFAPSSALAALDVTALTDERHGFDELRHGVAALRDGDRTTTWTAPGGPDSRVEITLDFSVRRPSARAWAGTFRLDPPANGALSIDDVSLYETPDLRPPGSPTTPVAQGGSLVFATADSRVVRLSVRGGVTIAEVDITAVATSSPPQALSSPGGTCDELGATLAWDAVGETVRGVEVARDGVSVGLSRGTTLRDATVRFDAAMRAFTYTLTPIGWDGATGPAASVAVVCPPALARPESGNFYGVIEGFYGRPWTWSERSEIVRALGAFGLDTYVYAPKDDPKHRDAWRTPYDDDALSRFAALAALGRAIGVRVAFGISPGADIDPANPDDVAALLAKVASLAAAGLPDAVLLLDDLAASPGAALGKTHAGLAATLFADMKARDPSARLLFVPTVYSGLAAGLSAGQKAYLGELAALPPEVSIAWTGQGVFAKAFSFADAANFVAVAGKPPSAVWIWDNYPVNDSGVFHRVYTFPIEGRESLVPAAGGLLANPMRHALTSIPALASYGELVHDPNGYAAARAAGAPLVTGALARELAAGAPSPGLERFFAELAYHDVLRPDVLASPTLTQALSDHLAASPDARTAARALARALAALVVAEADARREVDRTELIDEIDAHLRATSAAAVAGLDALASARAKAAGDATGADRLAASATCRAVELGKLSVRTILDAIAPLVPPPGAEPCPDGLDPLALGAEVLRTPVGVDVAALITDPGGEADATWEAVGPEGASVDTSGRLHFSPKSIGRYRVVALRIGSTGVSSIPIVVDALRPASSPEGATPSSPREASSEIVGGCNLSGLGGGRSRNLVLLALGIAALAAARARSRR